MTKVAEITDADFDAQVTRADTPVLLDFFADWCVPCKQLAPMLDDMADEFAGELTILKINADTSPATRDRFGVRGLPTLVLVRDGAEVTRAIDRTSRTQLAASIEKALAA